MRKTFITCACSIAIVASAVPSYTPLSIALSVGQWLTKDTKKVYYVQVEATADNLEAARQEALRLAVDMAVGTFVLAENEIRNDEVLRKDFIKYSSGYVENFETKNETKVGNKTRVVLDVWVSESKISSRLMGISQARNTINGSKSISIINNMVDNIDSGQKIFQAVLNDFPHRAFVLSTGNTNIKPFGDGLLIEIPVHIEWNQNYIKALYESLEQTRDGKTANRYSSGKEWASVIRYKKPGEHNESIASYRDNSKLTALTRKMIDDGAMIKVVIKDADNNSVHKQCFEYQKMNGYSNSDKTFFAWGGMFNRYLNYMEADFSIRGDFKDDPVIPIRISNRNALKNMSTSEVSIVDTNQCKV
jgi:hypothetical protein